MCRLRGKKSDKLVTKFVNEIFCICFANCKCFLCAPQTPLHAHMTFVICFSHHYVITGSLHCRISLSWEWKLKRIMCESAWKAFFFVTMTVVWKAWKKCSHVKLINFQHFFLNMSLMGKLTFFCSSSEIFWNRLKWFCRI